MKECGELNMINDNLDKYEVYKLMDGILKKVPCCHHCPESHLDDAVGWVCKEQNWDMLSELYGEDYNPYKVADECEYMKGWW